jgi:hypothetical protein
MFFRHAAVCVMRDSAMAGCGPLVIVLKVSCAPLHAEQLNFESCSKKFRVELAWGPINHLVTRLAVCNK